MDLAHGARQVIVMTEHVTKDHKPKLVRECTFPLTAVACVTRIYTSLAVVDIRKGSFVLREKLADISFDELQSQTGAELKVMSEVAELTVPELE